MQIAEKINLLEDSYENLTDIELKGKTEDFRVKIQDAIASGKTQQQALDGILIDVFAVAREATWRVLGT